MIGLKKSRRWALWFTGIIVSVLSLFAIAMPTQAAGTGTIEGGKYTVDVKGTEIELNKDNTTVSLSPPANGANIAINNGVIRITNVPTGTYSVTVSFKLSKDACNQDWWKTVVSTLSPALKIFCASTDAGDTYYGAQKVFTVTVEEGKTAYLEGGNSSGAKSLGNAVQTTADGTPVIDCSGKGFIMSFAVCPMIETTLGIIDWGIDNFIQPYLALNPLLMQDENGEETQMFTIWNNVRNLANIIFIGAFFVIIFSQATSIGISNYGIKRLLPRLVLIAIGTNLSFFVCAFLIDMANIAGLGVASLMVTTVVQGTPTISVSADFFPILLGNTPFGAISSLAAQGVLTAAILFGLFIFLIIAAGIIFITAIVVLIRQVLIIFLIIVSPLAFVAGLLPNTQKLFSQWFSLFGQLLIMYPVIMFLLAAGKVASTIIQKVAQ